MRRGVLLGTVVLVGVVTLGVIGLSIWAWIGPLPGDLKPADRVPLIGAIFGAGAFLLVALAALLALLAYLVATGAPVLEPEINFQFSFPNEPVFALDPATEGSPWPQLQQYRQLEGQVSVRNRGRYSARNVAMRVELVGMGNLRLQTDWTPVASANQVGLYAVQWEGGADYAVHGHWTRPLPTLNFDGVVVLPDPAEKALAVTLVAEGFKRTWRLPVRALKMAEYDIYTEERVKKINAQLGKGVEDYRSRIER